MMNDENIEVELKIITGAALRLGTEIAPGAPRLVRAAEGLTFASHSDWRIPNVEELYSICVRDATITAPYINQTMFPNTVSDYYWSSTSCPGDTGIALDASFNSGFLNYGSKASSYYVRAVRGGE